MEALASARITTATARYESGDPSGLAELREVTAQCRRDRLIMLRPRHPEPGPPGPEEGDWQQSEELLAESRRLDVFPGGHNILADYAGEAMRAYYRRPEFRPVTSSWSRCGRRTDLRAYARALREEPAADADASRRWPTPVPAGSTGCCGRRWPGGAVPRPLAPPRPGGRAAGGADREWGQWRCSPAGSGVQGGRGAALTGPEWRRRCGCR